MKDIIINNNYDLIIENGDFKIGECTNQNKKLLLIAQKGDFRASPTVGVGIEDWLEDDTIDDLPKEIRKEFERDGMVVTKITITQDGIINDYDAKYINY